MFRAAAADARHAHLGEPGSVWRPVRRRQEPVDRQHRLQYEKDVFLRAAAQILTLLGHHHWAQQSVESEDSHLLHGKIGIHRE
eukprot:scaffold280753_cov24-Tisochrysis_lutea.AAC.2